MLMNKKVLWEAYHALPTHEAPWAWARTGEGCVWGTQHGLSQSRGECKAAGRAVYDA